MEKADIEFLKEVMKRINQSASEFSKAITPILQKFSDEMDAYYKIIYPILRKEYESAGFPYGRDDDGMWRWLHGKTPSPSGEESAGTEETWTQTLLSLRQRLKDRVN